MHEANGIAKSKETGDLRETQDPGDPRDLLEPEIPRYTQLQEPGDAAGSSVTRISRDLQDPGDSRDPQVPRASSYPLDLGEPRIFRSRETPAFPRTQEPGYPSDLYEPEDTELLESRRPMDLQEFPGF